MVQALDDRLSVIRIQRELLTCGVDEVSVNFELIVCMSLIVVLATIPLSSALRQLHKIHKRKQRKRKNERIRKRRRSQALGVKRLLVRQDTIVDVHKKRNSLTLKQKVVPLKHPWEIEYKKLTMKKKIGAGNFGEVWLATWLGSPVAVKTVVKGLKGEFLTKFLEEIDLMSRLHHPNIVMFLGACITPPNVCLVLEYCVYGNLLDFLLAEEQHQIGISMHLILKMALDIARGINYLHQKENIIQRDIKSRNVLVDENLNAKVADFGLSRLNDMESGGMTACGTPAWTAPEVVRMEEYTEKVDVYSFGIVMWELIMRSEPYEGEGGVQIAYAAAEQGLRPEIPNFVPECYATLMEKCWAGNPNDRPNFGQILNYLFKMIKEESNPTHAPHFYFGARELSPRMARMVATLLTEEDLEHDRQEFREENDETEELDDTDEDVLLLRQALSNSEHQNASKDGYQTAVTLMKESTTNSTRETVRFSSMDSDRIDSTMRSEKLPSLAGSSAAYSQNGKSNADSVILSGAAGGAIRSSVKSSNVSMVQSGAGSVRMSKKHSPVLPPQIDINGGAKTRMSGTGAAKTIAQDGSIVLVGMETGSKIGIQQKMTDILRKKSMNANEVWARMESFKKSTGSLLGTSKNK